MRRLFGGRVATLGTNLSILLTGVLSSAIVSRALAPAGRGEYVTWQAWGAAAAIFTIGGLPQAVVLDDRIDGRHRAGELYRVLALTLGAGFLAVIALTVVLDPSVTIVCCLCLTVAVNQIGAIGPAQAQRIGAMTVEFNVARLLPQVAALLAMCCLLVVGTPHPIRWLLVVSLFQLVAAVAWMLTVAAPLGPPRLDGRAIARDTARLATMNWATQLHYRFDLLAVSVLFPPTAVGFYAVGFAAQNAVLAAGQASGMYWFSKRGGGAEDAWRRLKREIGLSAAAAGAVCVPLALSSGYWVPLLYGRDFAPAADVVMVLSVSGVLQSVDYLLAHDCLLRVGGGRVAALRLPSIVALVAGFVAVRAFAVPLSMAAAIPVAGYAVSVLALLSTSRRAIAPVLEPV